MKLKADIEYFEARVREWNETTNNIEKTESNKVALEDVNETLLEEFRSQERAIFGGDDSFHKIVSESLKEGEVREDILVAQRMLYKHRKDFFKDKIGNWTRKDDPWFTNGTDDTHYFEVIPFQITKNHDEVLRLAASNKKINIFFLSDSSSDDIERVWGVQEFY